MVLSLVNDLCLPLAFPRICVLKPFVSNPLITLLSVFMWHIFSDYNPLFTTWISFPDPKSQLSYIYLFVTFNSALVFKYQLSVTSHVKYTFNCYSWYYILWAFNSQSVLGSKDLVFASKGFSTSWPKSHLISWLLLSMIALWAEVTSAQLDTFQKIWYGSPRHMRDH